MVKGKLVISVDFDGTLVTDKFPEVGELRTGAKYFVNKLYNEGHYIIINTCRSGGHEGKVEDFLEKEGVYYHYINSNLPELIEHYKQDCRKISADFYIDDKCVAGLPPWYKIYDILMNKYSEMLSDYYSPWLHSKVK